VHDRKDLHNSSVRYAAAVAGRCGFTHLASGRTCVLRYRHPGPCDLAIVPDDELVAGGVPRHDKARRLSGSKAATVSRR
jgi:hypothetical protein